MLFDNRFSQKLVPLVGNEEAFNSLLLYIEEVEKLIYKSLPNEQLVDDLRRAQGKLFILNQLKSLKELVKTGLKEE